MNRISGVLLFFLLWQLPGFAEVRKEGSKWIISEKSLTVEFDEVTFGVNLTKSGGSTWSMDLNRRNEEVELSGGSCSLSEGYNKEFQSYQAENKVGVQAVIKSFYNHPEVEIEVYVYIDPQRQELGIEVHPTQDPHQVLTKCSYPRGFKIENNGTNWLVNPSGSSGFGSLDNLGSGINFWNVEAYGTRQLYMAWWGLLKNYERGGKKGEGFIAMVATPYDFTLNAVAENGQTTVFGRWEKSLGYLRYPRKMRYAVFSSDCDYSILCQRYRQFLIDEGRYRTFQQKAAVNPNVNKLQGVVQFVRYITQCRDGEPRIFRHTFASAQSHSDEFWKRFKNPPHFLVHIREWHEGEMSEGGTAYDLNLNGPMIQAGGWEGLKKLAQWCDQTDNFLYLYDTDNDLSRDSENGLYDASYEVREKDGSAWSHNWWCGHKNYIRICPVKRMELFKHNLEILINHGVNIRAIYLDITVIMEPRECYSTLHQHGIYGDPATGALSKEAYCRAIGDFYDWCARQGIIILSEHPVEWGWQHTLGSFFMVPKGGNLFATGRYVPLIPLVAHDTVMGGDYVDTYHTGADPKLFMHHLLHAIFPIARENLADDAYWSEKISDLHRSVGFERMLSHEFVNGASYLQRTTFANGVNVEVNYNTGEYHINGAQLPPIDTTPPAPPQNVGLQIKP
ncbi:hypothetical protein L0128_07755 [candidate division KSB1 bacterium]|nr:hypothetical protein [candidate division KSB1 bacterium]